MPLPAGSVDLSPNRVTAATRRLLWKAWIFVKTGVVSEQKRAAGLEERPAARFFCTFYNHAGLFLSTNASAAYYMIS